MLRGVSLGDSGAFVPTYAYMTIAYTTYAFFEWLLVIFDVAFDAVTALDFDTFELVVKDVKGINKGYVQ